MILFLLILMLFVQKKVITLNFYSRKKIHNAWMSALLLNVKITEISKLI